MRKLIEHIKEWKEELLGIPVALLIFFFSPVVLRWIDPTAGAYDAGVLQIIIYATVALLIFNGLSWMGIKLVFPEVFHYFQNKFKTDFDKLTEWQKVKIAFFTWAFLFACLVFLARVL